MTGKRTYHDACGIARALDIVGDRWGLLVIRELMLGPKRFTDIRAGLPAVSADVLAQRLRELEAAGVLAQRKLPPPVSVKAYELTQMGAALEPVLKALGRWGGANAPAPTADMSMSVDAHILHLSALFAPDLAQDFAFSLDLILAEDAYSVEIAEGAIDAGRGTARAPDAVVRSDADTFLALVRGWRELPDAIEAHDIEIFGDQESFEHFLGLFPLPAPAGAIA